MYQEYNYHTQIMGCDFDMTFITESIEQADECFTKSFAIAQSYEKRFSRFDKNSELSQLNREGRKEVSREFMEVYKIAYQLFKKTRGEFNPLVQVSSIGYDCTFEDLQNVQNDCKQNIKYDTNLDNIVIINDQIILQQTQKLDFGGFLKGYVVQKIAQELKNIKGAVINIGGDMYIKGLDCDDKLFEIEIMHPVAEMNNIKVSVTGVALCTSGVYKRKWQRNGEKKHHILNVGKRNSSSTDIISATVICKNGAVADAYATMIIAKENIDLNALDYETNIDFVLIDKNNDIMESEGFLNYRKK